MRRSSALVVIYEPDWWAWWFFANQTEKFQFIKRLNRQKKFSCFLFLKRNIRLSQRCRCKYANWCYIQRMLKPHRLTNLKSTHPRMMILDKSTNFLKINTGNKLQGQHLTCQCIGNSTLGCLENPSASWGLFSPRCECTLPISNFYFNRQNLLLSYVLSYHILYQDLLLLCPHHPRILLWTVRYSVLAAEAFNFPGQ